MVENEKAEDQEDESSSGSSSSDWQVVDETTEDAPQDDMISREQLDQDVEILGRERDDAMAEEFNEPTK